jgi:photosystem II stability/assembly factor-like uncharacterized protein
MRLSSSWQSAAWRRLHVLVAVLVGIAAAGCGTTHAATKKDGARRTLTPASTTALAALPLRRLWMTGAKTGWAEGAGALWTTTDGASSWTRVLGLAGVSPVVDVATAEKAVVAVGGHADLPGGLRLYTTSDAGRNWSIARVVLDEYVSFGDVYPTSLQTLDAGGLAILIQPLVGMNSANGALVWRSASGVDTTISETPAKLGAGLLPSGRGSVAFANRRDGLLAAQVTSTSQPQLYATVAAGQNWSRVDLPEHLTPLGRPKYFPAQHRWLVVATRAAAASATSNACTVLTTSAGSPASLRASGHCQDQTSAAGNLISPVFLDANAGWEITSAGQVLRTSDGGQQWRALRASALLRRLAVSAQLVDLDFATPRDGWVLMQTQAPDTTFVLRTTDRGATWETLRASPTGNNGNVLKAR